MLVLSRKVGQSIHIGNSVEVTVLDVRGGRVRIGLTAPSDVIIRRNEVERWPSRSQHKHELEVEQSAAQAAKRRPPCTPPLSKQIAKTCAAASLIS